MHRTNNTYNRPAGTGIVYAGSKPMVRGVWDLYETTNPGIGHFQRCFWLEYGSDDHPDDELKAATLMNLAKFFEGNIKDNLIILEFYDIRVMGGVSINAGTSYIREVKRKKMDAKRGVVDKWPDVPLLLGYELRFDHDDAVTFMTLWPGYDGKHS